MNGVRLANEFIYLIDDVIYMEKLDNYVMMIPIQLFVSFDNFYDFDRKIKDLITEISKYISIDDPSPILMCNIIDLNCTLDLKYPKISSDCYFDSIVEPILCHVSDTNIHICVNERENWNSNLSECQAKEIYAEKIHYHDYAECGLQTITVDAVSYCSVALDSLIMIGDGLTISVDNNVISLNI